MMLKPAGTIIRNVEGTTEDTKRVTLKRFKVRSWIHLVQKHTPGLDVHDVEQCAAYERGKCKHGGKARSLVGAHVKLDQDVPVYIIPLCSHHNGTRTSGLVIKSTQAFPCVQLEATEEDRAVVFQRIETHSTALLADLRQVLHDADDVLEQVERLLKGLNI